MTPIPTPTDVTAAQIAELLAWARSLSARQPDHADTAERAAFQAAKTDLLGRINHDPHTRRAETGGQR